MSLFSVVENTSIRDGNIDLGIPIEEARSRIVGGEPLVVKGIFPESEMREMVSEIYQAFEDSEPRMLNYSWGQENYLRVDNNPPSSSTPKVQAIYFIFLWNEGFERIKNAARTISRLRNKIAGLPEDYGLNQDDKHLVVPAVQHYPCGGGFMASHEDPFEPDKCIISLLLSERGTDFQSGGLYIGTEDDKTDIDGHFAPGDLFIFRPNIPHGIAPVDADKPLGFDAMDGRWRMGAVLAPNPAA